MICCETLAPVLQMLILTFAAIHCGSTAKMISAFHLNVLFVENITHLWRQ